MVGSFPPIVLAPEVHISKMILLRTATRGLAPQGNSSLHVVAGPIVISGEHTALAYVMGECKQTWVLKKSVRKGISSPESRYGRRSSLLVGGVRLRSCRREGLWWSTEEAD